MRALLAGTLDDYLRELESRFDAGLEWLARAARLRERRDVPAAPIIFERLGADVDVIADEPDGMNINAGCGSTHMEPFIERMKDGQVTTSDLRSTAMAIGCWRWTATEDRRRRRDHRPRRARPAASAASWPAGSRSP